MKTTHPISYQQKPLSMQSFSPLVLAGLLLLVLPEASWAADTLCVKYTKALFTNDTAVNELALVTAVVDLAVNGDADLNVPGIYAAAGGLTPFFTGEAGPTTNRGDVPTVVNFLDEGPNEERLLDHLYQFFGALLGCSAADFPPYQGDADMFRVHKFMNVTKDQNDFFIEQVGLAATALGVSTYDASIVGNLLDNVFGARCSPLLTASDGVPAFLIGTNPSICQALTCPLASANATCNADGTATVTTTPAAEATPPPPSLCVKYTKALFTNDTAANELALITAVVDLAVVGDADLNVSGIYATAGGLARFFDGSGPTTNRGDMAVSINFMDGGDNTAMLLEHLYQFFGALLGCSAAGFPPYAGDPDMFRVHKFMTINKAQNDFFIAQVGAAASALGVSDADVTTIATVLDAVFGTRCPPLLTLSDAVPAFLVGTNPSICSADSCPLAPGGTCNATTTTAATAPAPSPTAVNQPPALVTDDTLCVKYTKALFTNDTAVNELALITAVVDLAVVGDAEMNVPGILAPEGGLAGIFSGAGPTTNRGDSMVTINFLDGAGDLPNPDPDSNTAILLLHLYQFFGGLLGCSAAGFPAYEGDADMFRVHKFMSITDDQNTFFITQVGLAASALGVSDADVTTIGSVLDSLFNVRCAPLLESTDAVPAFLVGTNPSICTTDDCPLAPGGICEGETATTAPAPSPTAANQAPAPATDDTLCVKYTKALFTNDTAVNELALITAVVDLAVVGDAEMNVPGILAPEGGLAGIFSGAGPTTNRGDSMVTINFLDGAGDLPNPDPDSNTAILLLHLYQFFGGLLGCSAAGFPAYEGDADMFRVHKFMSITDDQNTFFITQVGLAASALGVSDADVTTIGSVLDSLFNVRCAPLLESTDAVPAFLVGTNPSICTTDDCPLAPGGICEGETAPTAPAPSPTAVNQPPAPATGDTFCVKYTKALFTNDTAVNELALITAVVDLAVVGDAEMNVPGILAPEGGLAGIFSGAGPTTNRGDSMVTINFLDGAGDLPNPDPDSNTAILLLHLYQFFGGLLGCSAAGFPAYEGDADMFRVHKFMAITDDQNTFFITQVGLAASALGVSDADVTTIGSVLDSLFNVRCAPLLESTDAVPAFLVGTNPSICTTDDCPLAPGGICEDETVEDPGNPSPDAVDDTSGQASLIPSSIVGAAFWSAAAMLAWFGWAW